MTRHGVSAPCKGCPNHAARCHIDCEEYAAYRKKLEYYNSLEKKQKADTGYFVEQSMIAKRKYAKRRRKGA